MGGGYRAGIPPPLPRPAVVGWGEGEGMCVGEVEGGGTMGAPPLPLPVHYTLPMGVGKGLLPPVMSRCEGSVFAYPPPVAKKLPGSPPLFGDSLSSPWDKWGPPLGDMACVGGLFFSAPLSGGAQPVGRFILPPPRYVRGGEGGLPPHCLRWRGPTPPPPPPSPVPVGVCGEVQVLFLPNGVGEGLTSGPAIAPYLLGLRGGDSYLHPLWPIFCQGSPHIFGGVSGEGALPAQER